MWVDVLLYLLLKFSSMMKTVDWILWWLRPLPKAESVLSFITQDLVFVLHFTNVFLFLLHFQNKPRKAAVSVTFTAGPRRSLRKMKRHLTNNKIRRDLTQVALRRASAILRSQKPVKGKKEKKTPKPKAE